MRKLRSRCARQGARWPCMLAAVLVLQSTQARGLQDRPTFRATAEIVRLQVAVFAEDGGPVPDLERSDFVVLQDGEERSVSVFFGPESGPLEVAVAMDASKSMASWPSRDVFHALLDGLHPESCVLLVPYRERVLQGVWGHPAEPRLRTMVDDIPQVGGSEAAYDALVAAFSSLRGRSGGVLPVSSSPLGFTQLMRFRRPGTQIAPTPVAQGSCVVSPLPDPTREVRRAVVIVTDERDSASQATLEDVLLTSWGSGIPVFALAVGALQPSATPSIRTRRRDTTEEAAGPIETLAKYTGGLVLRGTKGRFERHTGRFALKRLRGERTAVEGMERLGKALRGHYVLGFVPAADPDKASALIMESQIEVRVGRDGVEVLALAELVGGQGKSEGAAMGIAFRGFRELAGGEMQQALRTFDTATLLGPELGLTHYGRALALLGLGRHSDSLQALEEAQEHAPWLPDLAARAAQAHFEAGNFEAAWERALVAYYRGSEVTGLIERLQLVAPRAVDLSKPPVNPRVAFRAEGQGGLPAMLASPRLTAAVMGLAESSDVMQSGWDIRSSDLVLTVRITGGKVNGPWVSVRGQLVLRDREGREWARESFRVHDAQKPDEAEDELGQAFQAIEEAVRAMHGSSNRPYRPPDRVPDRTRREKH